MPRFYHPDRRGDNFIPRALPRRDKIFRKRTIPRYRPSYLGRLTHFTRWHQPEEYPPEDYSIESGSIQDDFSEYDIPVAAPEHRRYFRIRQRDSDYQTCTVISIWMLIGIFVFIGMAVGLGIGIGVFGSKGKYSPF